MMQIKHNGFHKSIEGLSRLLNILTHVLTAEPHN